MHITSSYAVTPAQPTAPVLKPTLPLAWAAGLSTSSFFFSAGGGVLPCSAVKHKDITRDVAVGALLFKLASSHKALPVSSTAWPAALMCCMEQQMQIRHLPLHAPLRQQVSSTERACKGSEPSPLPPHPRHSKPPRPPSVHPRPPHDCITSHLHCTHRASLWPPRTTPHLAGGRLAGPRLVLPLVSGALLLSDLQLRATLHDGVALCSRHTSVRGTEQRERDHTPPSVLCSRHGVAQMTSQGNHMDAAPH